MPADGGGDHRVPLVARIARRDAAAPLLVQAGEPHVVDLEYWRLEVAGFDIRKLVN